MSFQVTITLSPSTGSDNGPFDLYSDVDGFTNPFETGVSLSTLLSGYITTVPDSSTIVRVLSTGPCQGNYSDFIINGSPTTTTTTTAKI